MDNSEFFGEDNHVDENSRDHVDPEREAAEALERLLAIMHALKSRVQQREYLKYTMMKNGNLSYIYLANNKDNKNDNVLPDIWTLYHPYYAKMCI